MCSRLFGVYEGCRHSRAISFHVREVSKILFFLVQHLPQSFILLHDLFHGIAGLN